MKALHTLATNLTYVQKYNEATNYTGLKKFNNVMNPQKFKYEEKKLL